MRAVLVGEPGTVKVADVPEPRLLDPLDAVVQVTAAAICGADLFPLHGMTPGFDNATVLGHEFVGTVAEVGASVLGLRAGQRVVCSSTVSDGTCGHCRASRPAQCERRSLFGYSGVYPRLDGGQAELVRVPMADRCLLPLPDMMGDEQALFLADILPTGFAAVRNSGADLSDAQGTGCRSAAGPRPGHRVRGRSPLRARLQAGRWPDVRARTHPPVQHR